MPKIIKSQEPIVVPYRFQPRPYQLELFRAMDSGKNRALLRWCRRAGKDKTCLNYMIKKMFEKVGVYYYLFPEYAQGRKALWEQVDKGGMPLKEHFPPEWIKTERNNEMFIELKNGSIFRVVGTDKYDTIRGASCAGVVLSEFAYQDPAAWEDVISPILGESGGWAIFNSTPNGKNHMYDLELKIRRMDDWFFSEIQCLWPDRPGYFPVVPPEFIQGEMAAHLTLEKACQEYGVSYSIGHQGSYYNDLLERAQKEGRIGKFPHNPNLGVDTFWDLGRRDDTVIGFLQVDGRAKTWIDYYERSEATLVDHARILAEKQFNDGYSFRTHWLPHDGAAISDQTNMSRKQWLEDLLSQLGVHGEVRVAPKVAQKQFAIDAVRRQFPVYFFDEDKTVVMRSKLALYHKQWDKRKEVFLEVPVHDSSSHCADMVTTEALTADINPGNMSGNGPEVLASFDPFEDDSNEGDTGQILGL